MNIPTQKIDGKTNHLAEHTRALLTDTTDTVGEYVKEARNVLSAALDRGKILRSHVCDQAASRAAACDQVLHQNPYHAIGIAIGIGALFCYLMVGGGTSRR